jgi:hypothetical protein
MAATERTRVIQHAGKPVVLFAAHNKPYIKASAAVSDSGLHRVVISSIAVCTGRRLPIFPTRQQALEWVVNQ